MKTNKDIILVILAGLSICLGILLYFSVDYSKHLENQVSKMNLVINRDSLSKDYLDKTTWETDDLIKFSNNQTDEVIKLRKEKEMLLDSLRESSTVLDIAKRQYGMVFEKKAYKKGSVVGNSFRVYSSKLDSALMLLHVYRDKLKYNRKDNSWTVE